MNNLLKAYLRDVDARPEQLEVFPHFGWLVFGVEDGQLCEHAHVCPLQAQGSLHQSDELIEVAPVLVVVDQVLQLVCVYHDVQATNLCQAELLGVHTREADLWGGGEMGMFLQ